MVRRVIRVIDLSSPFPSLLFRSIIFDCLHGSVRKGPHHTHVVLPRLPVVGCRYEPVRLSYRHSRSDSYRLLEVGIQH
jgi:hypothetical protein